MISQLVVGIGAAIDNTIDVTGAAPEANVWGVRVLDHAGSGYLSDVDDIYWAVDN